MIFVTSDCNLIEPGLHGVDPDDEAAIPPGAVIMDPMRALMIVREASGTSDEPFPPGAVPLDRTNLQAMVEAGGETARWFAESARNMLGGQELQALAIRGLRCDERLTWRAIARRAAALYRAQAGGGPPWDPESNQLMGIAICNAAAEILHQDATAGDWNGPIGPRI